MREYIRREYVKPVLRFLIRAVKIVGIILLIDVIGLLLFAGQWNVSFVELLTILLLLEGSLVGAAGGFMFYGYSEYNIAGRHAFNPAIISDQRQRWRERRLSQQKLGVVVLIAGVLLFLLGLLLSLFTAL